MVVKIKRPGLLWLALAFAGVLHLNAQNETYAAYVHLADSLLQVKEYEPAARTYGAAFKTFEGRGYAEDRFKAARAWAMTGNADSAFFHLQRLAEKTDWLDETATWEDISEFASLKNDFRWTRLLNRLALKIEQRNAAGRNPLTLELESIYDLDQWYRIHWDSVISLHGRQSPEFQDFLRRNSEQDLLNETQVKQILDTHGWLGTDIVSEKANTALYLVIQHADLAVQEKYLPMMRRAVADGKATASNLAYLEDRVLMRQGKPQRYGSQIVPDKVTGEWILYEVEDPANLDHRRLSVGLGPIQDYLNSTGARMK
jgi:hypothetical protein